MSTTPTKTKKEDPLHRLSRTPTNAFRQQQWAVWKKAETHRHTPTKHDVLNERSSPMKPSSTIAHSSPVRRLPATRARTSPMKKMNVASKSSKLKASTAATTKKINGGVPTSITTKVPARVLSALTTLTVADDEKTLTVVDEAKAMLLFDGWDDNASGRLSLAELDKGIITTFPQLNHKPAIMRAYKATDTSGDGFVSRSEFFYFWNYLVHYNNLWTVFGSVDQDADRRISRDEWMASDMMDPTLFDQVDSNGGGMVLFDELCKYMTGKSVLKSDEELLSGADGEDKNNNSNKLEDMKEDESEVASSY